MYWQKRFDRENPDIELEEKIHEIHKRNKDYGYRRMCGELRNQGYIVNKKKVQRIMQKYNLQVMSFTRKSRKYSSYKGRIGTVVPNRIKRRFNTHIPHQKITPASFTAATAIVYSRASANKSLLNSYVTPSTLVISCPSKYTL